MNYPTFFFSQPKCHTYAKQLKTVSEQIRYFKYLLIASDGEVPEIYELGKEFNMYVRKEPKKHMAPLRHRMGKFRDWCESRIVFYQKLLELESEDFTEKAADPITSAPKIIWSGTEGQLIYLVKGLIENGFLPQHLRDKPFVFIEKHFLDKQGRPYKFKQLPQSKHQITSAPKIIWSRTEGQLIYLVKGLIENGFLSQHLRDEPFAFIEKHFLNKQGKPYKSKQLAQSKYQYEISRSRRPKNAEIIDQILEGMVKQKQKH